MRLKKLRLVNFQGHVDSAIEFSEFFNCIIGPTNSGKSSLFRALLFLVHNRWHEDFIHKPDKACTVIAEFDNDIALARRKGYRVNEVLLKIGDKKELYRDFGTKYPQPILDVLKNMSDELEDLILNFADQDDILFLLKAPNAARIKIFGQLTGVGVLEQVAEDIKSDHRKATLTKNTLEKRIVQLEEDAKKLPDIILKEKELNERKAALVSIKEKYLYFARLVDVRNRLDSFKEKRSALSKSGEVLLAVPTLESILQKYEILRKLQIVQDKIFRYKERSKNIIEQISILNQRTEKGNGILNMILDQLKVCPACGSILSEKSRKEMQLCG